MTEPIPHGKHAVTAADDGCVGHEDGQEASGGADPPWSPADLEIAGG